MAEPKWKEWVKPEKLILLQGWARDGLTDEQICGRMGINRATLYHWRKSITSKDDPRNLIFDTLKKGKEVVDYEVEQSLYNATKDRWVEEVTTIERPNAETGEMEVVEKKKLKKFVPASTTAQLFWLKNRKPNDWRDKREEVIKTDEDTNIGVVLIPEVRDE